MNQKVIFFIIVAAAIVAIAGFLLVSFLIPIGGDTSVPESQPADGANLTAQKQVPVQNESITVFYDPNKEVVIISDSPPVDTPDPNVPPTITPEPPTATPAIATPSIVTPPPDSSAPVNPAPPRPDKVVLVPYTVVQGDTLYSVAAYHVRINQQTSAVLMARFGIDSTDIVPGAVIQVPVANPAYCPASYFPYVVLEGENAFRIARKENTTAEVLRQINGLDANYTVYVSDVICVP